jgi:hypothetical protein
LQEVLGVCKGAISITSIADENDGLGIDWREAGRERGSPQIEQHMIGGGTLWSLSRRPPDKPLRPLAHFRMNME